MKTIAIVNQKGGTGKTTTTINLGSALVSLGKKVLLIDMDAQGNLGYSLGLDDGEGVVDVFEGSKALADVMQTREGLDVIPSDIRLVDLELSMVDASNRHQFLKSSLSDLKKDYDYVLIDCPPSLSILAVNALCAADMVIVPMLMEALSLQGLDQITQTIAKINKTYKTNIEISGVLPVMVDKRRRLTTEVKEYIDENYDLTVFDSMIRNNVKASEAPSFGQSVISYAPGSNSAKDYMSFAEELLKRQS